MDKADGLSDTRPADAAPSGWIDRCPPWLKARLRLSRYDRPVGFWLLLLPCLIGLAFAGAGAAGLPGALWLSCLFAIGSVAMRGAGCTWNDILDRDIDARVSRTAGRPLPSGQISIRGAVVWLGLQCATGLLVLLLLPRFAQVVALACIPLVILYPFMKRITWWPQAWLGLTFNWGFLVAWASVAAVFEPAALVAYLALAFWTLGYDTIYAMQDREDDALIGVRSTARLFGQNIRLGVGIAYGLSASLLLASGYLQGGLGQALAVLPFAGHLALQVYGMGRYGAPGALELFRSNRDAGLLLLVGWGLYSVGVF